MTPARRFSSVLASSARSPDALMVTIVSTPVLRFKSLGSVEREDLAVVHDRHPCTELVRFFHVVRREKDRLTVGVELSEDLPEGEATLGIEPGRWFVHEQHGGSMEDRSRHHQTLGHAAREGVHRRLSPLGQLELLEQSVGVTRDSCADAEETSVEIEVLPHRQLTIERVGLGHDARELLRSAGMLHTSMPATVAVPDVGTTRVVSMPAVVVFPAPFGPSSPKISPEDREVQVVHRGGVHAWIQLR